MDTANGGQSEAPMRCSHCQLDLPIRIVANRTNAIHFICAFCGARYAGFWLDNVSDDLKRNVVVDDDPRLG